MLQARLAACRVQNEKPDPTPAQPALDPESKPFLILPVTGSIIAYRNNYYSALIYLATIASTVPSA